MLVWLVAPGRVPVPVLMVFSGVVLSAGLSVGIVVVAALAILLLVYYGRG